MTPVNVLCDRYFTIMPVSQFHLELTSYQSQKHIITETHFDIFIEILKLL